MTEEYWKERYEAVKQEYRLLQKENEYLFWTVRQIKMKVATGDVVDALVKIGDIVNRTEQSVSQVNKNKKNNSDVGSGYRWSQ
jgi:hypothetical protein